MRDTYCGNCEYYRVTAHKNRPDQVEHGECRRFPPVVNSSRITDQWEFPAVSPGQWCGEHRATEGGGDE